MIVTGILAGGALFVGLGLPLLGMAAAQLLGISKMKDFFKSPKVLAVFAVGFVALGLAAVLFAEFGGPLVLHTIPNRYAYLAGGIGIAIVGVVVSGQALASSSDPNKTLRFKVPLGVSIVVGLLFAAATALFAFVFPLLAPDNSMFAFSNI
jgi:hypothetical protein